MKDPIDILIAARETVREPDHRLKFHDLGRCAQKADGTWCGWHDPDAVRFLPVGALHRAAGAEDEKGPGFTAASRAMNEALNVITYKIAKEHGWPAVNWSGLYTFWEEAPHELVLEQFDIAIQLLKAKRHL